MLFVVVYSLPVDAVHVVILLLTPLTYDCSELIPHGRCCYIVRYVDSIRYIPRYVDPCWAKFHDLIPVVVTLPGTYTDSPPMTDSLITVAVMRLFVTVPIPFGFVVVRSTLRCPDVCSDLRRSLIPLATHSYLRFPTTYHTLLTFTALITILPRYEAFTYLFCHDYVYRLRLRPLPTRTFTIPPHYRSLNSLTFTFIAFVGPLLPGDFLPVRDYG